MQFRVLRIGCAALFITGAAGADSVKVANAWARATAPGQTTAVVYLNECRVAAGTPLAQLHAMSTEGGTMRPLPRIELPAATTSSS